MNERKILPADDPDTDIPDAIKFLDFDGAKQPPNLTRDVLWTYQHLLDRRAKPSDAPGAGAWALLQWARQYQNRFFEQVLPKALTGREENEIPKRRARDRIPEAEIRATLQKLNDEMKAEREAEREADLRASVPLVLQQRARDSLSDWAQRFGISIPDKALASLDSGIVSILRDSLRAFAPPSQKERYRHHARRNRARRN